MKTQVQLLVLPLTLMLTLGMSGCVANPTNMDAKTLHVTEAQRPVRIQRGVVLSVDEVWVQSEGTIGASLIGAIIGAGLASELGGGSMKNWAIGAGAVIGGAFGEKATQYHEKAFAYIVELQNRRAIQIVQQGDPISPNTPVFVKYLSGNRAVLQVDSSQGQQFNRTQETQYVD